MTTASDGTTYTEDASACGDFPECHDETKPCGCLPPVPDQAAHALQEMHPDPFVQAATWRLYREAPGILDSAVWVRLSVAMGMDHHDMMDALTERRRPV